MALPESKIIIDNSKLNGDSVKTSVEFYSVREIAGGGKTYKRKLRVDSNEIGYVETDLVKGEQYYVTLDAYTSDSRKLSKPITIDANAPATLYLSNLIALSLGLNSGATRDQLQQAIQESTDQSIQNLKNETNPFPQYASGSNARYTHSQTSAADEWTVNHNLNVRPVAEVTNSGGQVVEAEILHISLNQLKVYFSFPFSGQVRCL